MATQLLALEEEQLLDHLLVVVDQRLVQFLQLNLKQRQSSMRVEGHNIMNRRLTCNRVNSCW